MHMHMMRAALEKLEEAADRAAGMHSGRGRAVHAAR